VQWRLSVQTTWLKNHKKQEKKKAESYAKKKFISTAQQTYDQTYLDLAAQFHQAQPFFYDKIGIWWLWDAKLHKWEMVDDIDIVNLLSEALLINPQNILNSRKRSEILQAMKMVGRRKKPQEAPKKWIQFKDKAFSLKSGKVYKVTPDYFFCNPIPWQLGDTSQTPIMDKLFEDWVGKKYKQALYEIIAYCCYTDYPIQVLFCLYGNGRNGKSCFLRLINKFLGQENVCSTELDRLVGMNSSRFESSKLYKKLCCMMGETNFGMLAKSSMLKKLTGGDVLGFEMKGKAPFDDFSYAKLLIASNSLPTTNDTSEGFYRRWIIIDFANKFPEGKDILKTIPRKEYNALAKKIMGILPNLIEKGTFSNQGSINARKQAYIMASNPLPFFLEKYCEKRLNAFIRYSELYSAYAKFLVQNNRRVITKKEFTTVLDNEGIEIRRTSKKLENVWVTDRFIEGFHMKQRCDLYRNHDSYDTCHKIPILSPLRKELVGEIVISGMKVMNTPINDSQFLLNHIKLVPNNNAAEIDDMFDKKLIEKLLREGIIMENPKGTYQIIE